MKLRLTRAERDKFSDAHFPHGVQRLAAMALRLPLDVPPPQKADFEADVKLATDITYNGVPVALRVRAKRWRKWHDFSLRAINNGHTTEVDKFLRGVGPAYYLFGYSENDKSLLAEVFLINMRKVIAGDFLALDAAGNFVYPLRHNGDGTSGLYLPIDHGRYGLRSLQDMDCIEDYWASDTLLRQQPLF